MKNREQSGGTAKYWFSFGSTLRPQGVSQGENGSVHVL